MQQQITPEERRKQIFERTKDIKNKIIVFSGKGGVGKTTVAVNLAAALTERGHSVGILDADIHGPNVPKMLGIETEKTDASCRGIIPVEAKVGKHKIKVMSLAFFIEKDSPVIWRGPMKMGLIHQFLSDVEWGKLDYLIVDLPPGTGDEALTIAQSIPDVTGSIVVTTPQDVSLLDSRKAVSFSRKLNIKVLGIIENMSGFICPHCKKQVHIFPKGGTKKASEDLSVGILGEIPIELEVARDSDEGLPFVLQHTKTEAAKAFNKIVDKLLK